jgi:hypothetical protein
MLWAWTYARAVEISGEQRTRPADQTSKESLHTNTGFRHTAKDLVAWSPHRHPAYGTQGSIGDFGDISGDEDSGKPRAECDQHLFRPLSRV